MNQYTTYTDKYLLDLLRSGDESAFTEIYHRYWDKLFFIAGTKLRELSIAEELVQDIFLDLWNRRTEIAVQGELQSYLAVAMKYKVINAQAKLKQADDYGRLAVKSVSHKHNDTESWLNFEELKEQLEKWVSKLPERCRLTYRLSREMGLSHKEISEKLDISEKAVESNITRALQSLRTQLNQLLSTFFSLSIFCTLFSFL